MTVRLFSIVLRGCAICFVLAPGVASAVKWHIVRPAESQCFDCDQPGNSEGAASKCCPNPSDSDFRHFIPGVSESDVRVGQCGPVGPESENDAHPVKTFSLLSTADAHHRATLRELACTCFCDRLVCGLEETPVISGLTRSRYFSIRDEIDEALAIRLVKLFEDGKIEGTEIDPDWKGTEDFRKPVTSIGRRDQRFVLGFKSCACSAEVVVELRRSESGVETLHLAEASVWGCV